MPKKSPSQILLDAPDECPQCGGEVRDRREWKVETGFTRLPDFDCRNPEEGHTYKTAKGTKADIGCGWGGWLQEEEPVKKAERTVPRAGGGPTRVAPAMPGLQGNVPPTRARPALVKDDPDTTIAVGALERIRREAFWTMQLANEVWPVASEQAKVDVAKAYAMRMKDLGAVAPEVADPATFNEPPEALAEEDNGSSLPF